MLDYDNETRRLFAREHAERVADDLRRCRPPPPTVAVYSGWRRLGDGRRGAAHNRHTEEPEPRFPAHDTSMGPT